MFGPVADAPTTDDLRVFPDFASAPNCAQSIGAAPLTIQTRVGTSFNRDVEHTKLIGEVVGVVEMSGKASNGAACKTAGMQVGESSPGSAHNAGCEREDNSRETHLPLE
jgi:hypothetical protein